MLTIFKSSLMAAVVAVAWPSSLHQPTPIEMLTVDLDAESAGFGIPVKQSDAKAADSALSPNAASAQAVSDTTRQTVGGQGSRAAVAVRPNSSPSALRFTIGDRVKIGVYELIRIAGGGPGGLEGSPRTFYQRQDIGGDYAVEQDGFVTLPLLGRLQAEGRSAAEVATDLKASFTTVFGREADVDVRIIDRPPVYVVGRVKNPGAYRYAPGMIVLQAIALAGGEDFGPDNLANAVEASREMERANVAALQFEDLVTRRTRLQAERDGALTMASAFGASATSPPPSPRRAEPDRRGDSVATFITAESMILRTKEAKREEDENEIALRVSAAQNSVDALKQKLDQFDAESALMKERLEGMEKLKDRGLVTSNNVVVLRTEMADLDLRRQDSVLAIREARARALEVEQERRKLELNNAVDVAKEMEGLNRDIGIARETMASARALAAMLKPTGGRTTTYQIVRQSTDGPNAIVAAETSLLTPGDVIKVDCDRPADPSVQTNDRATGHAAVTSGSRSLSLAR